MAASMGYAAAWSSELVCLCALGRFQSSLVSRESVCYWSGLPAEAGALVTSRSTSTMVAAGLRAGINLECVGNVAARAVFHL